MASVFDQLQKKISDKDAHIGVVGLGYVGLPLAVEFGNAGYRVTGIDLDKIKPGATVDLSGQDALSR